MSGIYFVVSLQPFCYFLLMGRKKVLALFDFDGTITSKDSFLEFLKFYAGSGIYYVKLFCLLPFILMFYGRIIDNARLKEVFLKSFIKGKTVEQMEKAVAEFYQNRVDSFLRNDALKKIEWHKEEGHDIALVSASASLWLKNFTVKHEMQLLCSELEVVNGRYTGLLSGINCNGREKVRRIKEQFNIDEYTEIHAYGDSSGDKEMLELATHPYFKPFN